MAQQISSQNAIGRLLAGEAGIDSEIADMAASRRPPSSGTPDGPASPVLN
jgi:hypothetical protein